MKVFDFTSGSRGKHIGDVKCANSCGGWLVTKDGVTYKVSLANPPGGNANWAWHDGATHLVWKNDAPAGEAPIKPEDFGVEAICFCTGEYHGVWEWVVLGTAAWNRAACANGILRADRYG
jgi:hypothetical protein